MAGINAPTQGGDGEEGQQTNGGDEDDGFHDVLHCDAKRNVYWYNDGAAGKVPLQAGTRCRVNRTSFSPSTELQYSYMAVTGTGTPGADSLLHLAQIPSSGHRSST